METTYQTRRVDAGAVAIVRTLLLIQGAIAIMSTLEVLLAGVVQGILLGPIILLTGGAAVVTLAVAGGVARRSRRARKTAIWIEVIVLVFAAVDLFLAVALARRGLELVPILTRIVLPITIIRVLRLEAVRAEFGLGPTRRQRRKAARA